MGSLFCVLDVQQFDPQHAEGDSFPGIMLGVATSASVCTEGLSMLGEQQEGSQHASSVPRTCKAVLAYRVRTSARSCSSSFKVTTSLAPSHSYPDGLASPMVRHFLSVCIGFYRSESVGIAVIKLSRNAVLALLEECHMKQDALHKTPQK